MNFSFTIYDFEKREGTGHRFSNCYSAIMKQCFSEDRSKLKPYFK